MAYKSPLNNTEVNPITRKPVMEKPMAMLSQGSDDSLLTKIKTIVSNPFDALKVAYSQGRSNRGDDTYSSLQNLRRANEAASAGNKDAQQSLSRSGAMNTASAFVPAALTAQTIGDAVSGDITSLALKKAKKLKPLYNALKSTGLDPAKATKAAYIGYKASKKF